MRQLKFILAALMLLACCSLSAQTVVTLNGVNYTINYGSASVSGLSDETITDLEIPSTIEVDSKTYKVTDINSFAFDGCSSLKKVVIGNSVTHIFQRAFYDCTGIESIVVPSSVTYFGSDAFSRCIGLKEVHISDLEKWCKINFADGGYPAGSSNPLCYAHNLYLNGEKITDLVIPESITTICDFAFYGCSELVSVTIPNHVTAIGSYAFAECSGLPSIKIPDTVTLISSHVFDGCTGLSSVELPNSVTEIERGAFFNCSGLRSITIPNSVTSIGDRAFSRCTGLKEVHITDLEKWCKIKFHYDNANPLIFANNLYLNSEKITDLVIPSSVTSINPHTFRGCTGLTSVEIPNSVTEIGESAFNGCTGLTSVEIPNSVIGIGESAFYGCTGLTSVEIPNSVTEIRKGVFKGCTGLSSVRLSSSISKIAVNLFDGCTNLLSIDIPDGVTEIGNAAFYECVNLNSVHIPNTVTKIEERAFEGCRGLSSIEIPNSVTSIEGHVFDGCSSLTSIVIPDSITTIENRTFYGCSNLAKISIPSSVTSIKGYAFDGCKSLKELHIEDLKKWCEITIEGDFASPLEYAEDLYLNDEKITHLVIPETVTSIAPRTFYNCQSITSLVIPNSVTEIGNRAFLICDELTSVELPASLNIIGDKAFFGYSYSHKLKSVIINGPAESFTLPQLGEDAFPKGKTLYVPSLERFNSIKTAEWDVFNPVLERKSIEEVKLINQTPELAELDGKLVLPLNPSEEKTIGLNLYGAEICAALQFDIEVPEGVVIPEGGVTVNAASVEDHKLHMNKLSSVANTYRVIVTSASNKPFKAVEGEAMFNVRFLSDESFPGNADITFKNLVATDCLTFREAIKDDKLIYSAVYHVESVAISGEESVNVEGNIALGAVINPENADYASMSWSSSDESVATVDENGVVTGVSKGTATITVSVESYGKTVTATKEISVTNFVREIALSDSAVTLERDKTHQFSATITPADADEATIVWSISDPEIASVDADGLLTALKPGTVTVTASNEKLGVSATANVTVNEYFYGDANDDGVLTLADVNAVIAYILEQNPQPFSVAKADMNHNGIITVTDVTLVTDALLRQTSNVQAAPLMGKVSGELYLDESGYYMIVSADAALAVNALQADIELPEGLSVDGVTPLGANADEGSVAVREIDNNTFRFILYSTSLSEFGAEGAPLLRIDLKADSFYESGIVRMTGVNANSVADGDFSMEEMTMEVGEHTAIRVVGADDASGEAEYYTLDGVKLDGKPDAGIYIVRKGNRVSKQIIK